MASKKIIASGELKFPVACQCKHCKKVYTSSITIPVSGTGYFGGSPVGRQERAEDDAKKAMRETMAYHVEKLYEESEEQPLRFAGLLKGVCPECGKLFPWDEIKASYEGSSKDSALELLFSKSKRQEKAEKLQEEEEQLASIPREFLPFPLFAKDKFLTMAGLEGVEPNAQDLTAILMHKTGAKTSGTGKQSENGGWRKWVIAGLIALAIGRAGLHAREINRVYDYSPALKSGTKARAEIVMVIPSYSVTSYMTKNKSMPNITNEKPDAIICKCFTSNEEELWMQIEVDDYQQYFDSTAKFEEQEGPVLQKEYVFTGNEYTYFADPVTIEGRVREFTSDQHLKIDTDDETYLRFNRLQ